MTGDTLSIALFFWGIAAALAVTALQSIQSKNYGWVLIYVGLAMVFTILGFLLPHFGMLLKYFSGALTTFSRISNDISTNIISSILGFIITFGVTAVFRLFKRLFQ